MTIERFLIQMAKNNVVHVDELEEDALRVAQNGVKRGKFKVSADGKVYSATEEFAGKFRAMYDSLKNKNGQD